jgi:hypothetical protein
MLLYQSAVCNKISRLLSKHSIKTIPIPVKKDIHMVRPIKDKLGLKVAGIYCISYECSKVYVRKMGRIIETRCKGHIRHARTSQGNQQWQSIDLKWASTSDSAVPPY